MCSGNKYFFHLLPWPCAAVAAAHAEAVDHDFSRRPGPLEVSGSHSTLFRGPPCTCGESVGNLPYPAGRRGENDGLVKVKVKKEGCMEKEH